MIINQVSFYHDY